jgi:cobaltochelatase CobS
MSIEDASTVRGKLYELGTVEIRWVGRWLNNNVKHFIDATLLAKDRHENVYRAIISSFDIDSIEKALDVYELHRQGKPPPEAQDPQRFTPPAEVLDYSRNITDMLGDTPEPVTETKPPEDDRARLVAQLLAGSGTDEKKVRAIVTEMMDKQRQAIAEVVQAKLDVKQHAIGTLQSLVSELVRGQSDLKTKLESFKATTLTIIFPDDKKMKELGVVHKLQSELIQFLAAGCSVFLTGPAGSGKSIAAEKAAQALDLPFYSISVCQQSTKTDLLGYIDATGTYRRTQYRDAYEHGGLYLIDEIDGGNANVLSVLNNSLSGSRCPFPDAMVPRHKNFRCVAAGNTWGTGRTVQYVGRNALDAATLNRFVFIDWSYDEALETRIADLPAWSQYVQKCRAEIKRRGINYLVTPRASIYGAQLLKAGIKMDRVLEAVLFPNLDPDIRRAMPPTPEIESI